MQETLSAGDYEAVAAVAPWAAKLRGLLDNDPKAHTERAGRVTTDNGRGRSPRQTNAGSDSVVAQRPIRRRVRPPKSSEYPKFRADGEHLVKIGWSKSKKKEYEHRAPKRVLEELARFLGEASKKTARFSMEDVLPLGDPDDGRELPSYQVYLCLAWLRHIDLVQKHGKDGYSLHPDLNLHEHLASSWDELPDRMDVMAARPPAESSGVSP